MSKYGRSLISGVFKGSFSCFDMAMNIMPATVLTVVSIVINLFIMSVNIFNAAGVKIILFSLLQSVGNLYITLFLLGLITLISEWRKIFCSAALKIFYSFTFPVFMLTYIPICISAFFTKVEWSRIEHTKNVKISSFYKIGKKQRYGD